MGNSTWGMIIACGKDEQLTADSDIAFLSLGGKPALVYSLMAFEKCADIEGIAVVARKERLDAILGMVQLFGITKVKKIAAGGASRKTSLQNGLKVIDDDAGLITVHESSRPCVTKELISETIKSARRYGCGIAAVRINEPVKEVQKGQKVVASHDALKLWAVHKPQTFKRELLEKGLEVATRKKINFEDETQLLELTQKPIHLVVSSSRNMRIQGIDDLDVVSALLAHQGQGR